MKKSISFGYFSKVFNGTRVATITNAKPVESNEYGVLFLRNDCYVSGY